MLRALGVACISVFPGSGLAECAPDDIRYLFRLAMEDDRPHGAFLGQITDMKLLSQRSGRTKEGWEAIYSEYAARFVGSRGRSTGFDDPVAGDLRIMAIDVPGLSIPFFLPPIETEAVYFFEVTGGAWLLRSGGCGGLWATTNKPDVLADALKCLANDGAC